MKSASLLISGRGCAPEWLHNHAFRSASFDADVDAFRGTVDMDAGQAIVNGLAIGGVIDDAFDAFGLRRESQLAGEVRGEKKLTVRDAREILSMQIYEKSASQDASDIVEDYVRRGLHPREGEELLAEVFYGGADMVEDIVYNQETVMNVRSCPHIYRCVLVVVSFYIQT